MSAGFALENVTIARQRRPVVHHITCAFPDDAFVGILGPNGAGKSSLLYGVLGWLPLASGTITIGGQRGKAALRRVSYLAQRQGVDVDYPITVEQLVAMGRYQRLGFWKAFGDEDYRQVDAAIAEMGLEPLRTRQIARLSGGQLQRAFLARALATGADVFLLDEPLAGLDPAACREVLGRLARWRTQGRMVIAVMHDIPAAREFCTHALLLRTHLIAAGPVAEALTDAALAEAFGPRAMASPADLVAASAAPLGPAHGHGLLLDHHHHAHGDDHDHDHHHDHGGVGA
jgi:manganese/zinc/iron transport system ATP- binding protein